MRGGMFMPKDESKLTKKELVSELMQSIFDVVSSYLPFAAMAVSIPAVLIIDAPIIFSTTENIIQSFVSLFILEPAVILFIQGLICELVDIKKAKSDIKKYYELLKEKQEEEKKAKKDIKLKEEVKVETKMPEKKEFDDSIIAYVAQISKMCDSLGDQYKSTYKAELKSILIDYTSKTKDLIASQDSKLSLDSEQTISLDSLKKLTILELKVKKQLAIEGKIKLIEKDEEKALSMIEEDTPVLKL